MKYANRGLLVFAGILGLLLLQSSAYATGGKFHGGGGHASKQNFCVINGNGTPFNVRLIVAGQGHKRLKFSGFGRGVVISPGRCEASPSGGLVKIIVKADPRKWRSRYHRYKPYKRADRRGDRHNVRSRGGHRHQHLARKGGYSGSRHANQRYARADRRDDGYNGPSRRYNRDSVAERRSDQLRREERPRNYWLVTNRSNERERRSRNRRI